MGPGVVSTLSASEGFPHDSSRERVTHVSGSSQEKPIVFDPKTVSGLTLDIDPAVGMFKDDAVTPVVDNDTIQLAQDQSGLGFDFSMATAGFRPTWKANILHGKPVVRSSVGKRLARSTFDNASALTVLGIVNGFGGNGLWFMMGNFAFNGFGIGMQLDVRAGVYAGPAGQTMFDGDIPSSRFEIWVWRRKSDGTSELFVNSIKQSLTNPNAVLVGPSGGNSTIFGMTGDAARLCYYNRPVTDQEMSILVNAANAYYTVF